MEIPDDEVYEWILEVHCYYPAFHRNEAVDKCECGVRMKPGTMRAHHDSLLTRIRDGDYACLIPRNY